MGKAVEIGVMPRIVPAADVIFVLVQPLKPITDEFQSIRLPDQFGEVKPVSVCQIYPHANITLIQIGEFPENLEPEDNRVGRKTLLADSTYSIGFIRMAHLTIRAAYECFPPFAPTTPTRQIQRCHLSVQPDSARRIRLWTC